MKAIPVAAVVIAFLLLVVLPALPGYRRTTISSTREVFINGQGYRLEKSAGDDASLVRRELLRSGIDVPLPGSSPPVQSFFADALEEAGGEARPAPISVPKGLRPEHVLHMKSDSGQIGIAVGSMEAHGSAIRYQLPTAGWKRIESAQGPEQLAVAIRNEGKETLIVLLEEEKGRFLLLRKPE